MRDTLDALPVYQVLLSQDYRVAFANRFFRERFGESGGRRCYEYLFARSQPCPDCQSFTPFRTKKPHRWEWLGPDGRNYDIHDVPFRDADGTEFVLETGIDVTERKQAEAELVRINANLESLVAQRTAETAGLSKFPGENPNPVLRVDPDGAVLYANAACRRLLGGPFAETGGVLPPEWRDLARRARKAGQIRVAEFSAGGKTWMITAAPIAGEAYTNLYAIDISERRQREEELARINRTLKAVSDSNQAMLRARDEKSFMEKVCRIIVEDCGHKMVWIGFAEEDEAKSVRPVAHFGFDEGYLSTLNLTWADTPRGRGPTGTAIRTGEPAQCRNMLADPAFKPWRAEAIRRGYASSIALPLKADGRNFGAMMIYSREPEAFSAEEAALLQELADDLGYGIQALRTRAARDALLAQVEEQRRLAELSEMEAGRRADELTAIFGALRDAVLVYDQDAILRRINPAGIALFGADPTGSGSAEIFGRFRVGHPDGRTVDLGIRPTARALQGAAANDEPWVFTAADGRTVSVQVSSSPLRKGGQVVGAVTVLRDVTEREELLAEMQRRTAELDTVINTIGDGLMIHGPGAEIRRMNPAAERMIGYSPEDRRLPFERRLQEAVRIETADGRPVEDLESLPVACALRGMAVRARELGIRQIPTGRRIWVTVTAEPLIGADGAVYGAVSSLTDITEIKEMENRLRESRDDLDSQVKERMRDLEAANAYNRSLIEASIDPQVMITVDGKIGDVNAATEAATGCSRRELIGTDFSDYFTDPEKARAGCRRVFADGFVSDYELELRHRDGTVMPVLYNASVFSDESGAVTGAIAAARDITMRRRAEARSREDLRRVEGMAEFSHLLAEAGLDYRSALDRIARTTARLLGDECHIHLPAGDGRLLLAARRKSEGGDSRPAAAGDFAIPDAVVQRVMQTRRPLFLPAVSPESIRRAEGPESLAGLAGSPLSALMAVPLMFQDQALGTFAVVRYAGGSFAPTDLALLDSLGERLALAITNSNLYSDLKRSLAEEQKARQRLIQSEKFAAMGQMLGSVAHELNNPLQTIKNCLYLVQQETAGDESIQDYVDMASSETHRLVKLVGQLRDLYRPGNDAGLRDHDLSGILANVRKLMEKQLADGKVEWRAADPPGRLVVRCDVERIEQVFINLTTNAIEAMKPGGGILTVSPLQSADGKWNGVSFQDTGSGIPEGILEKLFDPFVTTKTSGLGLGLSICYDIAQKHGGSIEAVNPPEGGARFTLWLPKPEKDSRPA